ADNHRALHSFPTRRSSDLKMAEAFEKAAIVGEVREVLQGMGDERELVERLSQLPYYEISEIILAVEQDLQVKLVSLLPVGVAARSEEHTSELQSRENLVCR